MDLETAEISSRVYNTRPSKQLSYAPVRGKRTDAGDSDEDKPTANEAVSDNDIAADSGSKHYVSEPSTEEVNNVRSEAQSNSGGANCPPNALAIKLITKLNQKLSGRIERIEQAKYISQALLKLRKLYLIDNSIFMVIMKEDLTGRLLANTEYICRYEFLTEECFNFIVPISRCPEIRFTAMDDFLNNQCLVFCLTSIRYFKHNASIRTQSLELISRIVDFIDGAVACDDTTQKAVERARRVDDTAFIVHQFLLHGAASSLPNVLSTFLEASSDIGVSRVLKCIKFLLAETTNEVATTIAMNSRWSALRDCLTVLKRRMPESQLGAAVVITGLTASSVMVAEKLIELRGWDILSSFLTTPDFDTTAIPASWLQKSMSIMKTMQMRNTGSAHIDIPPSLEAYIANPLQSDNLQSLDQLQSGMSDRDLATDSGPLGGGLSANHARQITSPKLSTMPNSYWYNADNRKPNSGSHQSTLKERLQNSPFGDGKKILEMQERRAKNARRYQQKLSASSTSKPKRRGDDMSSAVKSKEVQDVSSVYTKQAAIAERLFGHTPGNPDDGMGKSAIDSLSHDEKLEVMIMQVREALN